MKIDQQHMYMAGLNILAFLALLLFASSLEANNDILSPDFLVNDQQGIQYRLLSVSSDVDIDINGMIAVTHVRQKFLNKGGSFTRGDYVFPLPETASVSALEIRIGSRVIKGKLKEKQAAKKAFKKAQSEGKQAALMTQDRPNLFRMAVTNIPAGETIEVRFSYIDKVMFNAGEYRVYFPMTLTPRYNPVPDSGRESGNFFKNPAFQIESVINQKVQNPVSISVSLNPGFTEKNLQSLSHQIIISEDKKAHKKIRLKEVYVPMNQDFHLSWEQDNATLSPSLFTETINNEHYGLLMLTPPAPHYESAPLAKDVIYIIDTSGSMGGQSIRQARMALKKALSILNPDDSFNIIAFNNYHRVMAAQSQYVSHESLYQAGLWIDRLHASGGTNMKSALLEALSMPTEGERIKQIIFITDGAVGNENELMQIINQYIGEARLFSVAIGSAPNQHFFRMASRHGKGTFTKISHNNELDQQMTSLFRKIDNPAVSELEIHDPDNILTGISPANIPDVYLGEPLVISVKLNRNSGQVILKGKTADQDISLPINISQQPGSSGVSKLWARSRIDELEEKILLNQGNQNNHRQSIIDMSLKHHVLSSYTGFVAIDETPVRDSNDPLLKSDIPSLLPKGSTLGQTAYPKTAVGIYPLYFAGCLLIMLSLLLRRVSRQ